MRNRWRGPGGSCPTWSCRRSRSSRSTAWPDGGGRWRKGRLMSVGDAVVLSVLWLGCVAVLGYLMRRQFHVARFSVNLCFSVAYLVTFYLGFPLSMALVFGFAAPIVPPWYLGGALVLP